MPHVLIVDSAGGEKGTPGNPVFVAPGAGPATAIVTTVPVDAVATTMLLANPARTGCMIFNDANTRLYVKLAAGPTTGSFTVRIDGHGYFELPFPVYSGIITAIRAAGPATDVQVTELT
jgi:hypothetical protein